MTAGVDRVREALPEAAKDIALNLGSVLSSSALDDRQKWGVALACAFATRSPTLVAAIKEDAVTKVGDDVLDDAKAAASLMAMNNVYYRFRHLVGKDTYGKKPARLRMNRIAQPKSDKLTFELMSLAVSAINGCEVCIKSHEEVIVKGGLTEEHVHDAVRIAATVTAAAAALSI